MHYIELGKEQGAVKEMAKQLMDSQQNASQQAMQAAAGLLEQALNDVSPVAAGEAGPVPKDTRAAHRHPFPLRDLVEELGSGRVDQRHPSPDQQQRARVREAAGQRVGHVDDDPDAGLQKLLGGHAVEVRVVDDRDVILAEPMDEAFRPTVEPRGAGELDERAHC